MEDLRARLEIRRDEMTDWYTRMGWIHSELDAIRTQQARELAFYMLRRDEDANRQMPPLNEELVEHCVPLHGDAVGDNVV